MKQQDVNTMRMKWTNPSVLKLTSDSNPIEIIQQAARALVLYAIENGWQGPPFDPFDLAATLNYRVVPCQDVPDAMLIPEGDSFRVDFNPNQSHRRIRFSIAHELAHTLFPDCREQIRHRQSSVAKHGDDWQLEMLCNIAAGEILMPVGNLRLESTVRLTIDELLDFQREFDVSMEAILLRVVRLERRNCAIFVASPCEGGYRLDYAAETHDAGFGLGSGFGLPKKTRVGNCTAIGYTAKGDEVWGDQSLHIECVAIPGFPGQHKPRVAGIAYRKGDRTEATARINFVVGDATKPHGGGPKIIAHVVNDKAMKWGGRGFARTVARLWPAIQEDFCDWVEDAEENFHLGQCHPSRVDDEITVFSMIAQHGYGESSKPRIRYEHLKTCLDDLREFAKLETATIHMPRIGCGEAGGNWFVVQDLILECLSDYGLNVTVYDLPSRSKSKRRAEQLTLFPNF